MSRRALFVMSTRGQGHIVRCRALAAELLTRGWFSTMTNRSPLSGTSYDVSIVDLGEEEHAAAVYDALKDKPVVAIVDTPGPRLVDMIVCGSPGAKVEMFAPEPEGASAGTILGGGAYALLRPEFREFRSSLPRRPWIYAFDCREVTDHSAFDMAIGMSTAETVITYGGMRALEAACVRGHARGMTIEARNPGEELNKAGLRGHGGIADLIDGLGCKRVADAIEGLVK